MKRVLIITYIEQCRLYEQLFRHEYTTKVLRVEDYPSKQSTRYCIGEIVKEILDFDPQLIISDFTLICSIDNLEFLHKVCEAYALDERPLNLVIYPWDGFPSGEYQFLVDEAIPGPIQPSSFLKTVENMLASRQR